MNNQRPTGTPVDVLPRPNVVAISEARGSGRHGWGRLLEQQLNRIGAETRRYELWRRPAKDNDADLIVDLGEPALAGELAVRRGTPLMLVDTEEELADVGRRLDGFAVERFAITRVRSDRAREHHVFSDLVVETSTGASSMSASVSGLATSTSRFTLLTGDPLRLSGELGRISTASRDELVIGWRERGREAGRIVGRRSWRTIRHRCSSGPR